MKILNLSNSSGDVTFLLSFNDLERLSQLCQLAALATMEANIPEALAQREDLRTLAETCGGLFELAGMVAAGEGKRGLEAYRNENARLDFPNTVEGKHLARSTKKVDDLLCDVDLSGLDGEA